MPHELASALAYARPLSLHRLARALLSNYHYVQQTKTETILKWKYPLLQEVCAGSLDDPGIGARFVNHIYTTVCILQMGKQCLSSRDLDRGTISCSEQDHWLPIWSRIISKPCTQECNNETTVSYGETRLPVDNRCQAMFICMLPDRPYTVLNNLSTRGFVTGLAYRVPCLTRIVSGFVTRIVHRSSVAIKGSMSSAWENSNTDYIIVNTRR